MGIYGHIWIYTYTHVCACMCISVILLCCPQDHTAASQVLSLKHAWMTQSKHRDNVFLFWVHWEFSDLFIFVLEAPEEAGRDAKILMGLCSVHAILPGSCSYIYLYNPPFFCEYAISVTHRFEMIHGYLKCFPIEAFRQCKWAQLQGLATESFLLLSPVFWCLRIFNDMKNRVFVSSRWGTWVNSILELKKGLSWIQLSPWLYSGNRLKYLVCRPFFLPLQDSLMPRHWLDDIILAVTQ